MLNWIFCLVLLLSGPALANKKVSRILVRYLKAPNLRKKSEMERRVDRNLFERTRATIFTEVQEFPGLQNMDESRLAARAVVKKLDAVLTIEVKLQQPEATLGPETTCKGYCFELAEPPPRNVKLWTQKKPWKYYRSELVGNDEIAKDLVSELISEGFFEVRTKVP